MEDSSAPRETPPIVTDIPRFQGVAEPMRPHPPVRAVAPFRVPPLNLALFLLTLLTTTLAGATTAGAEFSLAHPLASIPGLLSGLPFSFPLMLLLLSHEMGHYLTSRRYGVDTSLPYFIPALLPLPISIGTFGAFIRMKSLPRSRRAMFDIGAAGPWAGFVIALVAIILGLKWSTVTPLDSSTGGVELGNSIIFWTVARWVLGVDPNTVSVNLHPTAFAGWIGLLVTTMNLLPVGQLDGGHVVYALFGPRWHRHISRLVVLGCLLLAVVPYLLRIEFWPGWILWFVLVLMLGLGHPATMDISTPLIGGRRLAAWATVLLFIVTFTPVPFSFVAPKVIPPPGEGPSYSVMYYLSGSPQQP